MPSKSVPVERTGPAWRPDPLIRTKLYIPQVRPNRVARPALLARLDSGLARRLTLIAAPAGFGKTTLLSDWVAAAALPVAWVSLDSRDNDPLRFATYFAAALGTLELGLGRSLPPLTGRDRGEPPSLEAVFTDLINEAAEIAEDFVVVLDDYHTITAEAIHAAVGFLLAHLPAQMHLVITSRGDPPLPLAQLRARGQLVELRAADLRFTSVEVRAFLNETMQLDLRADVIAALDARSEGWVASLQLAALALQASALGEAPAQAAASLGGNHRYLVDYLAEQVLLQQPPEVQSFLLATAVLDRLCAPLCDWVLDGALDESAAAASRAQPGAQSLSRSQAQLDYLERANLFLTPLDNQRVWYRYHPLFAEFLQARLRQAQPERLRELHRRAALWCEHHQLMEDAVRHALAAPDYELATRLIEEVAETLWARSQIQTMWRWLHAMPAELVRAQPRLCLQSAWACAISGQLDEVEAYLQAAETALGAAPPVDLPGLDCDQDDDDAAWLGSWQRLMSQVWILRAFVARLRGDAEAAIEHSERALALIPANCGRARCVALVPLGHAYLLLGQTSKASQVLSEAIELSRAARHMAAHLSAVNYLAMLRLLQGQLRQAGALFAEALEWVDAESEDNFSGIARIGLGVVCREQGDLDKAAELIEAGLQRAEAGGDFTFIRDGYVARARLEQARGNWEAALSAMLRAEQVARRSRTNRDIPLLAAWRARLWLAQGNLAAAAEWAAASGLSADDAPGFINEYLHLTLARVFLSQGRLAEAGRLLQRLLAAAEAAGRWGRVIEILAVQAVRLQARGETDLAQAALRRALRLAEPEGYVRVFADEGAPLAALLRQVRGEQRAYAQRLLAAMPGWKPSGNDGAQGAIAAVAAATGDAPVGVPPRPRAKSPALAAGPLAALALDPLSARECDVLRLIAAGLSNQDIAEALVVAPSTIQWHVKNIYSKLNVHSRTQAALAARDLGLAA